MADSKVEVRQCFSCDARFETDQEFWDHIYNVDCSVQGENQRFPPLSQLSSDSHAEVTNQNGSTQPLKSSLSADTNHACWLCDLQFKSSTELYEHSKSVGHREKVTTAAAHYGQVTSSRNASFLSTPNKPSFCEECQVPLPSQAARELHIAGKKHQKVIASLRNKDSVSPASFPPADLHKPLTDVNQTDTNTESEKACFFCGYCQLSLRDRESVAAHMKSPVHILNISKMVDSAQHVVDGIEHRLPNLKKTVPIAPTKLPVALPSDAKLDELNFLLRRLCLSQLLLLLHKLDGSSIPLETGPSASHDCTVAGVSMQDLLQLFRAVCREELSSLLNASSYNEGSHMLSTE
ncbi:hypothetical protein EG68_10441 [Paragonimus skrjabini miyazakii]|uniref:C2H2-type domain-containing protein n=1 Tax=Paragonimus skrjabini miyazakii TaxID=59628 RepID=A0A8S9YEW0_9TREM|nr:hypothetical protein EG68_10441 [Paragonimus skrjabini miyazakii]